MSTRTMRAHRATRTLVLAAVVAVGVAGCSGGDGDDEKSSEGANGYVPGPLDKFMEAAYGEWNEDEAARQANRVEELVAQCMAEQGFDYTPVDQSQWFGQAFEADELDVEWGTVEFAEQYGYGITTDPWGSEDEDGAPAAEQEYEDPNQEYVDAMSETEQQAYYEALHGVQDEVEITEDGTMPEEYEYDWTTAGCQGAADHEVHGGGADDEFADLSEEISAIYEAVEADPRLADLNAEWASCMADGGHSGYAAVGDAENALYDEMNVIWEEGYNIEVDPAAEFDESAWEEAEQAVQEKMKEITPREIALATVDYGCREKIGYDDKRVEVDHEYQQKFVDEHKTELEAWAEAMKASRS